MLNIVLIDSELETIPENMLEDYAVRKYAKERGKPAREILLDSNFLHAAIERYFPGQSNRMGRPDIFYHFLQVAQSSILNLRGGLRIYIHTKNDLVIEVRPDTRIPKSYNRFVGLIEDLFRKGSVGPEGQKLMATRKSDALEFLETKLGESEKILLSPSGTEKKITELFKNQSSHGSEECTVIIGGFSEGDFHTSVYGKYKGVKIFKDELTIWSVAMEAICQYERDQGMLS
ncbi:MAG: 16S rRNA methyltransferase [Thermoplasmataceae archaeon]|jgi:rRNA small subunit pseudouridine methyltransferase Nep1|nr:16S rRNA methyltransferase [Candidatus Thermoplasmatota archaeon]